MTTPAQRAVLASQALGTQMPSVTMALAGSDLSESEIAAVGGFVQGMGTSMVARMARNSGVPIKLSPEEQSRLKALKEDDLLPPEDPDTRGVWEKAWDLAADGLSNLGTSVFGNPLAHAVFTGFDKALDAVKLPARMFSDFVDSSNDNEIREGMQAQGYTPGDAGDYIAFMYNQGDSLYHDLDPIRAQYGDEMVDTALDFFADPEAFTKRQMDDPQFQAKVSALMSDPDWERAADLVDRAHISPGRDLARILLTKDNEDGAAFTAISGALDAAYTIALDPTLILGKGIKLARAADALTGMAGTGAHGLTRFGLARNVVGRGIDRLSHGYFRTGIDKTRSGDSLAELFRVDEATGRPVHQIGKHIEQFLGDVHKLDTLTDEGEILRLEQKMQRLYEPLLPLIDEIRGRRVQPGTAAPIPPDEMPTVLDSLIKDANGNHWPAVNGDKIETLAQFGDYMVSTVGLLRLGKGYAAQARKVMPGRISARKRLQYMLRGVAPVWDHSKLAKNLPHEVEEDLHAGLDELEARPDWADLTPQQKGELAREVTRRSKLRLGGRLNGMRARHDQRMRRLTTLLPTVSSLDLHSAADAEQVRRFARLYLSRREADLLAAQWRRGNANERRAIARGMLQQTKYAAGMHLSEQGERFWRSFEADQATLDRQMYGFGDADVIHTDRGEVHVALAPSQLSSRVLLPSFRETQYMASKYNAASWFSRNVGARFYSSNTDAAMTSIKMGWITTGAGGLRNAIDELAGLGFRGELPQVLKFRALYSKANRAYKTEARKASREYRKYVKAHGAEAAEEEWARRLKAAEASGDAERIRAARFEHRVRGSISLGLRGVADKLDDVFMARLLTRLATARNGDEAVANSKTMRYLGNLIEADRAHLIDRTIKDTFLFDDVGGASSFEDPKELLQNGLHVTRYGYRKTGYELVEVDGGVGSQSWADNIAAHFTGPHDPAYVALQGMWNRMTPRGISEDDLNAVVEDVRQHLLNSPEIAFFRENAELTNQASDPELHDAARRIVANTKLLLTGRGRPEFDPALVDEVREHFSAPARERARERAERQLAQQPQYDDRANEALQHQTVAREERDALRQAYQDTKRVTKAQQDLERRATSLRERIQAHATFVRDLEEEHDYEGLSARYTDIVARVDAAEGFVEQLRGQADEVRDQIQGLSDQPLTYAGFDEMVASREIDDQVSAQALPALTRYRALKRRIEILTDPTQREALRQQSELDYWDAFDERATLEAFGLATPERVESLERQMDEAHEILRQIHVVGDSTSNWGIAGDESFQQQLNDARAEIMAAFARGKLRRDYTVYFQDTVSAERVWDEAFPEGRIRPDQDPAEFAVEDLQRLGQELGYDDAPPARTHPDGDPPWETVTAHDARISDATGESMADVGWVELTEERLAWLEEHPEYKRAILADPSAWRFERPGRETLREDHLRPIQRELSEAIREFRSAQRELRDFTDSGDNDRLTEIVNARFEHAQMQQTYQLYKRRNADLENTLLGRPAELPFDFYDRVVEGEYEGVPDELRETLGEMADQAEADGANLADLGEAAEPLMREALNSVLRHEVQQGRPVAYLDDVVAAGELERAANEGVDEADLGGLLDDMAPPWVEITTPEQLEQVLSGQLDGTVDPTQWRIAPIEPRVTDTELDLAKGQARQAGKDYRREAAKAKRNRDKAMRNDALAQNYVYDRHIDDDAIRKYLKDTRGVQLTEGSYGNGKIHPELVEMLLSHQQPGADWLARLPEEYKPTHAIKERFTAVLPQALPERLLGNWTEFLAKGYQKLVTDQVQALVRNPLLASKYVEARETVEEYEKHLIASGWDEESANAVAHRIALSHAEQEVLKHIDNPQVASQFSVLARSFWAFERAQEDWLRRWGRNLRDDPAIIRKGQLGIHGGEAAGILHQDDNGELTFTYPGSGALVQAITKILPGSMVNIPVVPDLETKVTFVNPSLDNPAGFSATPIISVPFRAIAATLGADYPVLMNGMDRVINGEQGAGRAVYEQFLPTMVNRIVSGVVRTDRDSQYGQAWMQSVAQMEAAGTLDGINGADAGEKQGFFDTLSAQVRNNMFGRALFGMFAPASPGLPTNAVDPDGELAPLNRDDYGTDEAYEAAVAKREQFLRQGTRADWAFHKQGLASLRDEARVVFRELPYEEAMEWWVKNHPGELILAPGYVGTTKVADQAGAANAPATLAAAKWMEDNAELLREFPGVAVYFMPQGNPDDASGEFSQVAYNSQLEQGVRQKKELAEFLDDVIVKRGESIYYDTKDDYDAAIARAQRAGDEGAVENLKAQWQQEKALIEATNPLFAAKNASFAENELLRQQQVVELGRLMNDPRGYKAMGEQALGVERLADAYAAYTRARDQLAGQRGSEVQRQRAQLTEQYQAVIDGVVGQFPGLADLTRGIFRIPSS